MEYRTLGRTGIRVSRLCFGTLTLSPLQRNFSTSDAARLLHYAVERGINFFDTAEYYRNYDQLRAGLSEHKYDVVICSKTYAFTAEQARNSVHKALRELQRDYIDIFMLHEQESALTLKGHHEALEELERLKHQGKIRAVGISTHYVAGALAAAAHPVVEVVHPIINYLGLGIVDGDQEDMRDAVVQLAGRGKGVYAMKALGGGNLYRNAERAFNFVLGIRDLAAIAVGMQSCNEVDANVHYFEKGFFPQKLQSLLRERDRRLHIADWCSGCGKCIERCPNKALYLKRGKAAVDHGKCLLCGYCSGACEQFCIKVI